LLPSGSLKATKREDISPDVYEVGERTQLSLWVIERLA